MHLRLPLVGGLEDLALGAAHLREVEAVLQHAGEPFTNKERAFLFGGIAFLFLCLGAGRFSADARIVKR